MSEADGVQARARRLFGRGEGADRIAYYSDAVFAIAMTLLVLDVGVPLGAASAVEVLQEEWPSYAAFALSFAIIAYFWVGHHRRFRVVTGYDTGFIVINLVLLFLIASLPFPTKLISEFAPETLAVVLYAAAVTALCAVELIQWAYARRRGLLAPTVDRGVFWFVALDVVPILAVFGLSIPIALIWGGEVAMYGWFATFVLAPFVGVVSSRALDRGR